MDNRQNSEEIADKKEASLTDKDFENIPKTSHELAKSRIDDSCTKCKSKKAMKNGLCQECIDKGTKVFQT